MISLATGHTRFLLAAGVSTASVKNAYLTGARDTTDVFKRTKLAFLQMYPRGEVEPFVGIGITLTAASVISFGQYDFSQAIHSGLQ